MRCKEISRLADDVAGLPAEALPATVREHLAGCATCRRRLDAARLATGLVRVAAEGADDVPEGFARRVVAGLPRRGRAGEADLWRPAWGLIPAFTAAAVALLVVYQTSGSPVQTGFVPLDELSAGEELVLQAPTPEPDQVLGVVLGVEAP